MKDDYLGDGVYASFDGYHIILDLRAQGSDRIALEPPVMDALIRFRQRCAAEVEERHKRQQAALDAEEQGKASRGVIES